jgi:serine/threonine-protein phosphatase 2A regulatory subunit B'
VDDDEMDEDEPIFEPVWPHLQIVYELLLRLSLSSEVDASCLKRNISGSFVVRLLELFKSEDHRERDYLKTILHRIYAKCMSLRQFIRKSIHNVFYAYIYGNQQHNGVAELLEILGSIINGLALPLKLEHRLFLANVLTPLHKVPMLANFHPQLAYCVSQFVDKDPALAVSVVGGLLRFWPATDSGKELLFLNELEELLDLTQPEQFHQLVPQLTYRLGQCVCSPHFQVAERALFFWQNEHIADLMAQNCDQVLPILYPALYQTSQEHWNPNVNSLGMDVLKAFQDINPSLVDRISDSYDTDKAKETLSLQSREQAWTKITRTHAKALLKMGIEPIPAK